MSRKHRARTAGSYILGITVTVRTVMHTEYIVIFYLDVGHIRTASQCSQASIAVLVHTAPARDWHIGLGTGKTMTAKRGDMIWL